MGQLPKFNTENKVLDGSFDQCRNSSICLMEIYAGESENMGNSQYLQSTYILRKFNWNSVKSRKKYQHDLNEPSVNSIKINQVIHVFNLIVCTHF